MFDFGNPFDPQRRKLDGTFDGPKPLDSIWDVPKADSIWDVPKSEGGGWLSAPAKGDSFFADLFSVPQAKAAPRAERTVDRRNVAEVAKHGAGGGGVGPVGTLVGCLVIIAIFAALGFVLIG